MPFQSGNQTLYRIGEALRIAQVSRATYFRWVRSGRVPDTRFKDRNGRRVFTPEELRDLTRTAEHLIASPMQLSLPD
jgi:DNA-binding transcriptional MerR regulator